MKTFEQTLANRIEQIQVTLGEKAAQYQRGGNRYHNFDKGAALTGQTPEQVLWGMALKHVIALDDYIRDLPERDMSQEQWEEKIGDIIIYLILLEGLRNRSKATTNALQGTKWSTEDILRDADKLKQHLDGIQQLMAKKDFRLNNIYESAQGGSGQMDNDNTLFTGDKQ